MDNKVGECMNINDISLPDIYTDSQDFRFFRDWFKQSLEKLQYDTENFFDLYDPLKCPEDLLWVLGDTMGYKYDDRLPSSFNRLVLLYFMSMIKNRGSKNGVTLAAEVNLAQFKINMLAQGYTDENGEQVEGKEILYNRLEDTSIPVNSVYVTPHTAEGYIDVVYFSTQLPTDACLEYVRPVGMFMFQQAGVRFDARTKISVDARLTDSRDIGMSFGPTSVGHYRRADYATMQRTTSDDPTTPNPIHIRNDTWYRNSDVEDNMFGDGEYGSGAGMYTNPGYRALQSLQLSNNEEIVKALIDPIFSLGYEPQDISVTQSESYLKSQYDTTQPWNLRYDRTTDEQVTPKINSTYIVETIDKDRTTSNVIPAPAVNPIMATLGDTLSE